MTSYDPDNVFARILAGTLPSETVFEDADTRVIMDIMPRGDGHVLVIPNVPSRNLLDIDETSLMAVARTVRRVARAARAAFDADGVTVQQFNEAAGGQVVFHTHVHVIPRFAGVSLRPHSGAMEAPDVLRANAQRWRAVLSLQA